MYLHFVLIREQDEKPAGQKPRFRGCHFSEKGRDETRSLPSSPLLKL